MTVAPHRAPRPLLLAIALAAAPLAQTHAQGGFTVAQVRSYPFPNELTAAAPTTDRSCRASSSRRTASGSSTRAAATTAATGTTRRR